MNSAADEVKVEDGNLDLDAHVMSDHVERRETLVFHKYWRDQTGWLD